MPISVSNRMDAWEIADILQTIVFWVLVLYIAWNEKATPSWMYVVLLLYILYYAIQFIVRKQGMDRAIWLYSLNMVVILYLLFFFGRK